MRFILELFLLLAVPAIILVALQHAGFGQPLMEKSMALTSPAFSQEGTIPDQYTCKGADISPSLSWQGTPAGTKSFALIVEDPDAPKGAFTHWVAYNLHSAMTGLPDDLPKNASLDGLMQGKNSSGATGYTGPCPPAGNGFHHYYFRVYALDSMLDLQPGADKADVMNAMNGHILAQGELMGRYEVK